MWFYKLLAKLLGVKNETNVDVTFTTREVKKDGTTSTPVVTKKDKVKIYH